MAPKHTNNRVPKRPGGSRYAALAILSVIILAVAGYLLLKPHNPVAPPSSHLQRSPSAAPNPADHQHPSAAKNYSTSASFPSASLHHPSKASAVPPVDRFPVGKPSGGTGRFAIIVDDMGGSMQEARALAGIGVPLTFSIIPGLRSYREVAAFAASRGIATMIHIPMQSKGWPERRLEANGLLVSMSNDIIAERLDEFIQALPTATGANNHMGSEFTEHEEQMGTVLDVLKQKGLFFVDSVTSPHSVGVRLAHEIGVKSARRGVFLDNEQDSAYIHGQLNQAIRMAKKTGGVIAICHPHPVTIRTLAALLPKLEAQGVTLVPASALVN